MRRIATLLGALAMLVGMGWAAQRWAEARPGRAEWALDPGLMDSGAGLGILLLGAWFMGRVFAAAGIPQLVGYLVFGMVVGPSSLDVVGSGQLKYLALVNDLAIALIALTAGGELHFGFLRRAFRAVASISVLLIATILAFVTIAAALALPGLSWTTGLTPMQIVLLALTIASVTVALSPAVVIAVLSELESKGPMSSLSLAIVVAMDMGLILVFTALLGVTSAGLIAGGTGGVGGAVVTQIGVHLIGSLVVGALVGVLTGFVIERIGSPGPVVLVLACVAVAAASQRLQLESLLVALAAGIVLTNAWPDRTERLFDTVRWLSTPVYCVFFAVAGAKLDLDMLASMWPLALGLTLARIAAIWIATAAGLALTRQRGPWTPWLWTAFVPQAGVALALVLMVEQTFEATTFGTRVFTLLVSVVAMNELVGPVLLKMGLERAGETAAQRRAEGA